MHDKIPKMIEYTLNGETRRRDAATSVACLLDELGLTGKRLAVEKDGEIVPKSRHAECLIEAGSRVEIVVAVGGG